MKRKAKLTKEQRKLEETRALVLANKLKVPLPMLQSLIQCRPGCSHCCRSAHEQVAVLRNEAGLIAGYIMANNLDSQDLRFRLAKYADLQERIEAVLGNRPEGDYSGRIASAWADKSELQTACPLLDLRTDRCSVYPVRPWNCRTYDSISEDECKKRRRGEPADVRGIPNEIVGAIPEHRAHLQKICPEALQSPGTAIDMSDERDLLARAVLKALGHSTPPA